MPSTFPGTYGKPSRYNPRLLGGGSAVPFVGQWTGEETPKYEVIRRPEGGIGYADETVLDRDEWNVLWARLAGRIGTGRPLLTTLHSLRQRRAMLRLWCQVCANPADRNDDNKALWLLPHTLIPEDGPEGMATTQPPVCADCARLSVRMCPALRTGHVALWASTRVLGVTGVVFQPAGPYPRLAATDYADVVRFTDPAIRWTLAAQQVRELIDITDIDLERLA